MALYPLPSGRALPPPSVTPMASPSPPLAGATLRGPSLRPAAVLAESEADGHSGRDRATVAQYDSTTTNGATGPVATTTATETVEKEGHVLGPFENGMEGASVGGSDLQPETPLRGAEAGLGGFDGLGFGFGGALTGPEAPPEASTAPPAKEEGEEREPVLTVFSGGTAFNGVAGDLKALSTRVAHVIPVSDDGGSTAEIVRVLGGPAVGDIRSRCLRLADASDDESRAVRRLLAHRLPAYDAEAAKHEWYSIVEGQHELWRGVSDPYKHTIRAFLVHFHQEILRCSGNQRFVFRNGSVGNFFFAGARIFFRSLEASIFLFSRVARIPTGSLIMPAISTEDRITLGAELIDGTVIRGQHAISHPSDGGNHNIVDKNCAEKMSSPIRRIFYLSAEGTHQEHEVQLQGNGAVLEHIDASDATIYAMGSLYTSICPSLILRGVGERVAASGAPKVLLLNATHDRETSSAVGHDGVMSATDFVQAITDALNRKGTKSELAHLPGAYVSGLIVPAGGRVPVDFDALTALGVQHIVEVETRTNEDGAALYMPGPLLDGIRQIIDLQTGAYDPTAPEVETSPSRLARATL